MKGSAISKARRRADVRRDAAAGRRRSVASTCRFGGVRSAKGELRFCLTADPVNFPSCIDDARATTLSVPAGRHSVHFEGLPRGDYALAVIHDDNGNAKLDTFAGIPREGFGFSNNPPLGFGPPRFAAARFSVATAASAQQVSMRYIL